MVISDDDDDDNDNGWRRRWSPVGRLGSQGNRSSKGKASYVGRQIRRSCGEQWERWERRQSGEPRRRRSAVETWRRRLLAEAVGTWFVSDGMSWTVMDVVDVVDAVDGRTGWM